MKLGTKVYADSQIDNPTYTLTSTKNEPVSTKANPNETTVLIFGHTKCSYTRSTLNSISSCNWVKRSDIRVIFAETNGKRQEEVLQYEAGYQCPEMTFCYDEGFTIMQVMAAYANLFGMGNGGTYPTIVLIDKNNKLQNILTGATTADNILNEIKKFEDIDDSGSNTPPSDSDSGIENIAYGLTSIENTPISTKANPNETTVLLFGYTTCGNTKATLQDIDQSDWVNRSDIRVIFADVYGADLDATKEFAQNYTSKKIIFCHDESFLNYNLALTYLSYYNLTGGQFPYIVLIDQHNKIQSLTLGPKTADEIITEIEKFTKKDSNTEEDEGGTGSGSGSTGGDNTGDTGSGSGSTGGDNTGDTGSGSGSTGGDNTGGTGSGSGSTGGDNTGDTGSGSGSTGGDNTGNTGSGSGSTDGSTGNTGNNTGTTTDHTINTFTPITTVPDNTSKPDNTADSDDTSKPDNTADSDDTSKPDNTADSNDTSKPDSTETLDETTSDNTDTSNPPSNTLTPDTTDTSNQNTVDKSETKKDKPNVTVKKKATVKTVKAVKGKKVISGTVKLKSGKLVQNATIKVYVNNKKKATIKTDKNGEFSTKLSKKLKKGDKIKFVITNAKIKKIIETIKIA